MIALLCLVKPLSAVASVKVSASPSPPSSKDTSSKTVESSKEEQTPLSLHAIPLTSKNFGANVGDGNVWLIEFYTPW
jgi:hypothetical protein